MNEPECALRLNQDFVEMLRASRSLKSESIAQALLNTPRHLFLDRMHTDNSGMRFRKVDPKHPTKRQLERIYSDEALLTRKSPPSSTSQPTLVVQMLEALDVQTGDRILEIGAGTGWNAGLMGSLTGRSGEVVTIEIQADIARAARKHLKRASVDNVTVITGDGARGHDKGCPYDRLITTVACPEVFRAWLEQLADDGVMLLTISDLPFENSCLLIRLQKQKDHLVGQVIGLPGFMQLTGRHDVTASRNLVKTEARGIIKSRPRTRERPFWAAAQEGMKAWLMRDLVFFARLQGFQVTPTDGGKFLLAAPDARGVCVVGPTELKAYTARDCLERFRSTAETWLGMGAPSRAGYRVQVWPRSDDRKNEETGWMIAVGTLDFLLVKS